MENILNEFSRHRLNGEAIPDDVKKLLAHSDELKQRLAVELNWSEGWAPWLDTSYLSAEDMANPQISGNVKAIHEVCGHINFIAMDEESQYFGYWRGTERRPIAASPLVLLDNEGQFRQCPGSQFAEALFANMAEIYGQKKGELRDWLRSLGIKLEYENPEDVPYIEIAYPPAQMHDELYKKYTA